MTSSTQRGSRLRALARHDFCPEFSAKVRRLVGNALGVLVLTGLAALLCGLFLHPRGLVLFGGIAVVILLGVLWPWLSLRGLRGHVGFERPRISEGESVEVRLTLHSRLPWTAPGLALRGAFDAAPVGIASAPARRTTRYAWTVVAARRGVYPRSAPRLTTGFPFGLWENARPMEVEAPLVVWPRTFAVGPVPLPGGDQQIEGNVSRGRVGSTGDVLGVRPYRRGDSPRRIHWGQSARHDRLIVCELQSCARPLVQLVLDADPAVHTGQGIDGSLEWAIRVAASLARGWLAGGAQVGAVWGEQVHPADSGPAQVRRLLDGLARLAGPAPALAQLLALPACRAFGSGLTVIVTTDAGLARAGRPRPREDERWVVLRAGAFTLSPVESPPPGPAFRPWLWIDGPGRVPELLRGGWKEARHGS